MTEFLLRVWRLVKPYRTRLLLGVVCGIVCGFIEPLMIATITFVYSMVFSTGLSVVEKVPDWAPVQIKEWLERVQEALSTGSQAHAGAVIALVALIPLVLLLRGVFTYLNTYLLSWTAMRAVNDLRVELFTHLTDQSASFFSKSRTGELMSRILGDTGAIMSVISSSASIVVRDPVTLMGLLAFLFWGQPKLTLISLVVMPVCMVPIMVYSRKIRRSSSALQTEIAELANIVSETFTGNRIVKAYNLEARVIRQFLQAGTRYVSHNMRLVRSGEIPGPLLEFVGAVAVAIVILYLAFQPGARTSSGSFLAVVLAVFAMYRPLKNLARLNNQVQQARAASDRVFVLLATPNTLREPERPQPLNARHAEIRYESITFAYDDQPVLQDINLTVRPSQVVALVGRTGSGKTTITNLLLRFYDPQHGAVRIGGVDVRDVAIKDLRDQIAVVTQETILFNDTIFTNIRLGRPSATREEVIEAARHAHAYEFIMDKPEGFDTMVGEKGVMLSGGQRQRVAIARAIIKDAPILLLDEATSALDTESERAVQAALDGLMEGRTTLCIAHRLSTIRHADVIVVLDRGRIVEQGKHDELIESGGFYRKLYEMQFQD